ncbi:Phospholipase A2 [Klebsormidium nitens]|uniref:Phospholipase A2 n=1 Tax=Klebsormidium nitens TaxID=105231 RepID=A0A1Y1HN99_KLENI|nr:Phospholipase A2 [Klebsormidium nitens]|eukprot:GAQ79202.1 Phospholipase A2 [Klebsormidium nitens]
MGTFSQTTLVCCLLVAGICCGRGVDGAVGTSDKKPRRQPVDSGGLGTGDHGPDCSKVCVAKDCNTMGLRYGKYCGVGWTGCPGEEPCDPLDACCKKHDECCVKHGLLHNPCHKAFKKCMARVRATGKKGFSAECPYSVAIPAMEQGMDLAMMFGQGGMQQFAAM